MKSLSFLSQSRAAQWSARLCAAAFALAAPFSHSAPSTTVVIGQVYGGGGNTSATYTHDFIELHNISNSSVSIAGWSVQYTSATGSTWQATNLSGSIPAGGYHLVRQASGGANGAALPTPDTTGTINMSGTAGKVALVNSTTLLTGTNPVGSATIVDFVGYGATASAFEGSASSPAPSNSTSVTRIDQGSQDTDQNGADFTSGTPTPRNSATTPYIPTGDATSPTTLLFSPADNATQAFTNTNLAIKFDESIKVGAAGTIYIKTSIGDTVVETITLPSAKVTASGSSGIINPDAVLDPGISYYVEITAGTFTDFSNNPAAAVTGTSAWNFTTRSAGPSLVINQYYEGAGTDRYIELKNLTGSPLPLDGYRVAAWSDTSPSDNEGWKSGVNTTTRVTNLTGEVIPANGTFLIAEIAAAAPSYAASNNDLPDNGGCTAINGDDSVVLYTGTGFTTDEIVDAVSISAAEGTDTSFYRLSNAQGFGFAAGNSILNYGSVWGSKTVAEVASAAVTDDWYLQASNPPATLTLGITPVTFSEAAGNAAATATVTRSSPTTEALLVVITVQGSKATSQLTVDIPATQSSAQFPINAVDDPWLTGDATVTFTVSASGHVPDSVDVTVTDQGTDVAYPIVINEVDADQASTDTTEFIELYNNSGSTVSLAGLVLVMYNGGNAGDPSYSTIDLSAHSIPPYDYLVIGSAGVTNVDLAAFTTNGIQNGTDAIALYLGDAGYYPNGTLPANAGGLLVDAIVYAVNSPADNALLAALLPVGEPLVDEDINTNANTQSMSRVPDGGLAFDTSSFAVQTPTPGATNVLPDDDFAAWIAGFDFSGFTNPDLSTTGDPDNDGLDNALENIFGTSPTVFSQGLSAVSTGTGTLKFRHTLNATLASDLTPSYEWSPDLVNWYASGVSAGDTTVTFSEPVEINAGPPALVEITASITGTTPGKVFARIKVE